MSEITKILSFLLEKKCDIKYLEAVNSLRVTFHRGNIPMCIVLNDIDFFEFKEEYQKVWDSVPEIIKYSNNLN